MTIIWPSKYSLLTSATETLQLTLKASTSGGRWNYPAMGFITENKYRLLTPHIILRSPLDYECKSTREEAQISICNKFWKCRGRRRMFCKIQFCGQITLWNIYTVHCGSVHLCVSYPKRCHYFGKWKRNINCCESVVQH